MKLSIIGAGLSGLIAGHYFRQYNPVILEAQPYLPNNHHALLRFGTNSVAQVTGVNFNRVLVRKFIYDHREYHSTPNPASCNSYSIKVTNEVMDRSIWKLDEGYRYIAPPNFIQMAARSLEIKHDSGISWLGELAALAEKGPVISTIPMPLLMKMVDWKVQPNFKYKPIWSAQVTIEKPKVDVYQTIYYPDPTIPLYRASITGNILILEFIEEPKDFITMGNLALRGFGLDNCYAIQRTDIRHHPFGKILPCDETVRRDFIYTMTRNYNLYSLGRFATWRQLLLDDVVDDCKVIERLISADTNRRKYQQLLDASRP